MSMRDERRGGSLPLPHRKAAAGRGMATVGALLVVDGQVLYTLARNGYVKRRRSGSYELRPCRPRRPRERAVSSGPAATRRNRGARDQSRGPGGQAGARLETVAQPISSPGLGSRVACRGNLTSARLALAGHAPGAAPAGTAGRVPACAAACGRNATVCNELGGGRADKQIGDRTPGTLRHGPTPGSTCGRRAGVSRRAQGGLAGCEAWRFLPCLADGVGGVATPLGRLARQRATGSGSRPMHARQRGMCPCRCSGEPSPECDLQTVMSEASAKDRRLGIASPSPDLAAFIHPLPAELLLHLHASTCSSASDLYGFVQKLFRG